MGWFTRNEQWLCQNRIDFYYYYCDLFYLSFIIRQKIFLFNRFVCKNYLIRKSWKICLDQFIYDFNKSCRTLSWRSILLIINTFSFFLNFWYCNFILNSLNFRLANCWWLFVLSLSSFFFFLILLLVILLILLLIVAVLISILILGHIKRISIKQWLFHISTLFIFLAQIPSIYQVCATNDNQQTTNYDSYNGTTWNSAIIVIIIIRSTNKS